MLHIQLLLTGNELMTGDIVDSNSAMIAEQFLQQGLHIRKKVTVGDDIDLLVEQLRHQTETADVLLVNGGLGPTGDDLTCEALARLTGHPLVEHPQAKAHLEHWCQRRGTDLNAANYKQVMLPQGAEIIPNPRGSAVGIRLLHQDCEILCTPGVPSELKVMLEQSIVPGLKARHPESQGRLLHRFHTFGLGESGLQQWVTEQLPEWPPAITLGFRSGAPTLEVKVEGASCAQAEHNHWVTALRQLIGDYIVAEGRGSLKETLVELLKARGQTLTTAESCTGGLIASQITQVPGSSAVFESGYVTYANGAKTRMLGVDTNLLEREGAVSEAVVRAMARGALERSGADYGVAVSGIAGPDGGTPDKPVGLVWLAWGTQQQLHSACLYMPYGRRMFQTMVAGAALDLVRRSIQGIEREPRYLRERRPPTAASC